MAGLMTVSTQDISEKRLPCVNTRCWTEWFDRDNPSGTGDWETLRELRIQYPGSICDEPLYIEAVTVDTMTPALATGQNFFIFNPTTGFVCRNSDQTKRGCLDYKGDVSEAFHQEMLMDRRQGKEDKVKLTKTPKRKMYLKLQLKDPVLEIYQSGSNNGCWTEWFDRDNPSGTGDWETLRELRIQYPGSICDEPLYIEAVTVDTMTPALATGQNFFIFNPTTGFVCRNSDQTKRGCLDYKGDVSEAFHQEMLMDRRQGKEDKVKLTKTPKRKMYLKLQLKDPVLEIYQSGSNNGQAMRVDDLEVGDRCALQ
ncbi:unnamed protein product [Arctogadus glacialis]